jgi:hypothetical protein
MHHKGYLTMTGSGNSRQFAIVELDVLRKQFDATLFSLQSMEENFSLIQNEFQTLQGPIYTIPTITLLEGTLGIQQAYTKILTYMSNHHLIVCHCIASKTFESLAQSNRSVEKFHHNFIEQLTAQKIQINGIYGEGMSLMESILSSHVYTDASNLPTSNDAIQMRIAGDLVSIFIMKKSPQIIQITSHELANMWMFLAEQLGK